MEHDAADQLHRVGTHAQDPVRCLPDGSEGLGEQVVQGLALLEPLLEEGGLALQRLFGEGLVFIFQGQDLINGGADLADLTLRPGTEQFRNESHVFSLPFVQMAISNQFNVL